MYRVMIKRYLAYALGFGIVIDIVVGLAIALAALMGWAKAETLVVGPDHCASPADLDQIAAEIETIVRDHNYWREAADGVIIVYGPTDPGWASNRLTSRFIIDPKAVRDIKKPKIICLPSQ